MPGSTAAIENSSGEGNVIPVPSGYIEEVTHWLIGDGRLSGDAVRIVDGYLQKLRAKGVPIIRARVAQRLANPLLAAWGIIWTPKGAELYSVPKTTLDTEAWRGSPFQTVLDSNRPLHKSLRNLTSKDHHTYHELAGSGGTDFYVTTLEYGDGSSQGCSFLTDHPSGFESWQVDLIENTRSALAAALEPVAMRRSAESLLKVYLGNDPAKAVADGAIERGQQVHTEAAIMFADLRGFTHKSVNWPESELLSALDDYFETVVEAVHKHFGDVLKLLGDGVLAMFPDEGSGHTCCRNAVLAAQDALAGLEGKNTARRGEGKEPIHAGFGLSYGTVTYGNIGSSQRLDFTIVGAVVNRASRIQGLCKVIDKPIILEKAVADRVDIPVHSEGGHELSGIPGGQEVFSVGEHVNEI